MTIARYVASRFQYQRRQSREVRIGNVRVGGDNPLVVQSMCTTPTQDVAATVKQCIALAEVGCEIVRVTAPGVKDAEALKDIRRDFSAAGFQDIPLCADIHFMPKAAMVAVEHVEKVRVNPGNFADKKSFAVLEYTDQAYNEEIERVAERFLPLVERAQTLGRALRIGSNHGSLSDRIMNRFGDTPAGMVESAMEFIKIAESAHYYDMVVSMKSSNPKVMIEAYRLLCKELDAHGQAYPLHLGVTEAGDGEDARIKSACGIGALLEDGIGDTVRVSLTEDPCAEIPVAQALCARYSNAPLRAPNELHAHDDKIDPFSYERRLANKTIVSDQHIGGDETISVLAPQGTAYQHVAADIWVDNTLPFHCIDIPDTDIIETLQSQLSGINPDTLIGIACPGALGHLRAYRLLQSLCSNPIVLYLADVGDILLASSICGDLLADGIGDAIYVPALPSACDQAFTILQAMKARMTRTDYVACPSCGRTLFDLMDVTAEIKAVTDHLDNVTIAIMGCIVNGPGEMADADFGYVGSGPDKITLYQGKDPVIKNIPATEARDRLIQLIKDSGKWHDVP